MTVYDVFLFSEELDTLEIRLHTLEPVVDVFVLVEGARTFAGKPKPLNFKRNAKRFKAFNIRHVVANLDGLGPDRWQLERASRDAAAQALQDARDEDWVMFGDVDEIMLPENVTSRARGISYQSSFRYYYNLRSDEFVFNTVCMPWGEVRQRGGMASIRHDQRFQLQNFRGGWHFSTMGDVVEHLQSRSHGELDTPEMHDRARRARAELADPVGRDYRLTPVSLDVLPPYILANRERFRDHLWGL